MARKTKKQQRKFEEGIKALLGFAAFGTYIFTQDIKITTVVVCLVIVLIITITIFQARKEKERLRKSRIADIDKMDGIQFEHYLKELYTSQGYKVEVTQATGDYGADLILKKDDKKIAVQAKRYSNNVGIKAVQEIIAAKNYYNATDAWVVSNSDYTKAAHELAGKSDVLLIDRDRLIDTILKMNPNAVPNVNEIKIQRNKDIVCERCGSYMVIRNGKRGQFYGCSNFPKCQNTKNIQ